MSLHSPSSPVRPRARAHARHPSGPSSSFALPASPTPRSASRSERLLRDTLRRDDRARSHSRPRGGTVSPPPFVFDSDEDPTLSPLLLSRTLSSPGRVRLVRAHTAAAGLPGSTPSSPPSSTGSPPSPRLARAPLSRAPATTHAGVPHPARRAPVRRASSRDSLPSGCTCQTPTPRPPTARRTSAPVIQPMMIPAPQDGKPITPLTPPPTPPHTAGALPRHARRATTPARRPSTEPHHAGCPSSSSDAEAEASPEERPRPGVPLSPATSFGSGLAAAERFDARVAGEACRRMEGYVSFGEVAGLGTPEGVEEDEGEEGEERRGRVRGGLWKMLGWARGRKGSV